MRNLVLLFYYVCFLLLFLYIYLVCCILCEINHYSPETGSKKKTKNELIRHTHEKITKSLYKKFKQLFTQLAWQVIREAVLN